MITVSREWMAKSGLREDAIENAKEYRELFDTSSSWRIRTPTSERYRVIVEEDYESYAEAEEKWNERGGLPEFGSWIIEWKRVAVENTLAFNYHARH